MSDVITGLPCNSDGLCMVCNQKPSPEDLLSCTTCASPWHLTCLSVRPETSADALVWQCPDSTSPTASVGARGAGSSGDLVAAIRALETDESLSEAEKAKKRQELMSKNVLATSDGESNNRVKRTNGSRNDALDILIKSLTCSICFELPERPVTVSPPDLVRLCRTPCGHNFCLKCFEKWVAQRKLTCANCRQSIPSTLRINSNLVGSIRIAKASQRSGSVEYLPQLAHRIRNQDRPDKAFTTERAKKPGKANASSGRIFVTSAPDHFGPITAEYDPEKDKGVAVGETWGHRIECRQWGIHRPMVSGISGQCKYGAQSVVLSGGYIDDEDHGEWFIYTGSGGKDLSGNKRTNKQHSKDQTFTKLNQSLSWLSCLNGYPVRVVRSHKETRSSYAPTEVGLRYDGVYRIEKCWRKDGTQGYKVCRYLFVRCDNEPAPWMLRISHDMERFSYLHLNWVKNFTEHVVSSLQAEKACWMWKKPRPLSRQLVDRGEPDGKKIRRVRRQEQNAKEKVLKGFRCD
ncbi:E3 ubiquitin-protein ligase ORTHRUS 2 [Rosa sericea]